MSLIVERLTPPITSLMKLLTSGTCDHRLLWGTVCVVLDGVQELLESPGGVALGAAGMIGAACNHQMVWLYTMFPGHAGHSPKWPGSEAWLQIYYVADNYNVYGAITYITHNVT